MKNVLTLVMMIALVSVLFLAACGNGGMDEQKSDDMKQGEMKDNDKMKNSDDMKKDDKMENSDDMKKDDDMK
jgi:hypothetical protein